MALYTDTGTKNLAIGRTALYALTGTTSIENLAIGMGAGSNQTNGNGNIYIGNQVAGA